MKKKLYIFLLLSLCLNVDCVPNQFSFTLKGTPKEDYQTLLTVYNQAKMIYPLSTIIPKLNPTKQDVQTLITVLENINDQIKEYNTLLLQYHLLIKEESSLAPVVAKEWPNRNDIEELQNLYDTASDLKAKAFYIKKIGTFLERDFTVNDSEIILAILEQKIQSSPNRTIFSLFDTKRKIDETTKLEIAYNKAIFLSLYDPLIKAKEIAPIESIKNKNSLIAQISTLEYINQEKANFTIIHIELLGYLEYLINMIDILRTKNIIDSDSLKESFKTNLETLQFSFSKIKYNKEYFAETKKIKEWLETIFYLFKYCLYNTEERKEIIDTFNSQIIDPDHTNLDSQTVAESDHTHQTRVTKNIRGNLTSQTVASDHTHQTRETAYSTCSINSIFEIPNISELGNKLLRTYIKILSFTTLEKVPIIKPNCGQLLFSRFQQKRTNNQIDPFQVRIMQNHKIRYIPSSDDRSNTRKMINILVIVISQAMISHDLGITFEQMKDEVKNIFTELSTYSPTDPKMILYKNILMKFKNKMATNQGKLENNLEDLSNIEEIFKQYFTRYTLDNIPNLDQELSKFILDRSILLLSYLVALKQASAALSTT